MTQMMGYVEQPRAWGYTRGMARAIGVNLPDAVVQGWLSREELAALVDTCGHCGHTGECTDWLARPAQPEALPGFCPNSRAIAALKP